LPDNPTLDQVLAVVNANTGKIQSYSTRGSRISVTGQPATLRANIALERPRRFRLLAETGFTGPEVDMGSNDELFWFWVRRAQPPALYFSRHDQFAHSSAREMIPIQPTWLIDALGMPTFDATARHSGPRLIRNNEILEVRSDMAPEEGSLVKLTMIDAKRGWVMEQHVYTPQGERIASAIASAHRYDPATSISLPGQIEVQVPKAQLNLRIDAGDVQINRLSGDPQQLFAKPTHPGFADIDLGAMTAPLVGPPAGAAAAPANEPTPPPGRVPLQPDLGPTARRY
jgi:hypothetical protein